MVDRDDGRPPAAAETLDRPERDVPVGGGFAGNELAKRSQTLVWRIGVRYDDGSFATIQQTSAPNLRIGDRVRVTGTGIELLR